jgi:glycerol-3-phosphate acyltransferase PlsY
MKFIHAGALALLFSTYLPALARAAGGKGVAEGFGGETWLSKWPVLLIVLLVVVACTTFITTRVVARARREREA